MINKNIYTVKSESIYNGKITTLKDILISENNVPKEFYINKQELDKWIYLKGAKSITRTNKLGNKYNYTEGNMTFPDDLNKPAITIITGEGGKAPSRFKHIIKVNSKYRRLTPIELERINMFPDNHTMEGTDIQRAFLMGNALVTGVIEKVGKTLAKFTD